MPEVELVKIIQGMTKGSEYFLPWKELCLQTGTKVVKFSAPPPHWFLEGRILGVDFEGCPPCLCQISCSEGVYINTMSDPLVQMILKDPRHLHAVFSSDDMKRVKNGFDTQVFFSSSPAQKTSLHNAFNREFETQFWKDSSIHARESWRRGAEARLLTSEQVNYAASDALATRLLAYSALEQTGLLVPVLERMRAEARGGLQLLQLCKSKKLSSSFAKPETKRSTHRGGRRGSRANAAARQLASMSLSA